MKQNTVHLRKWSVGKGASYTYCMIITATKKAHSSKDMKDVTCRDCKRHYAAQHIFC